MFFAEWFSFSSILFVRIHVPSCWPSVESGSLGFSVILHLIVGATDQTQTYASWQTNFGFGTSGSFLWILGLSSRSASPWVRLRSGQLFYLFWDGCSFSWLFLLAGVQVCCLNLSRKRASVAQIEPVLWSAHCCFCLWPHRLQQQASWSCAGSATAEIVAQNCAGADPFALSLAFCLYSTLYYPT